MGEMQRGGNEKLVREEAICGCLIREKSVRISDEGLINPKDR